MNPIGQIGAPLAAGKTQNVQDLQQTLQSREFGASAIPIEDMALLTGAKGAQVTAIPVAASPQPITEKTEAPAETKAQELPSSIAVLEEKPFNLQDAGVSSGMVKRPRRAHGGTEQKNIDATYIPGAKSKLIHTETTVKNMAKISRSIRIGENVLLEGPTGAGKTALVKYLAHLTNNPLRRINLSNSTDITEIIGGFVPAPDGSFKWKDGIVTEAMRKGHWLLLDEMNLASAGILERLNSIFDDRTLVVTEGGRTEAIEAHQDFRIFATQNPEAYAGRQPLSDAMKNRLHIIWVDEMKPADMVEVVSKQSNIDSSTLLQMAMFHKTVADLAAHDRNFKKGGPYPFTLRDLQKWVKRVDLHKGESKNLAQVVWNTGRRIYEDRFSEQTCRDTVEKAFRITFGGEDPNSTADVGSTLKNRPADAALEMKKLDDGTMQIGIAKIPQGPGGPYVPGPKSELVYTKDTVEKLSKLAQCAQADEPALLMGPTAAGKTSLVKCLARLTNNNVRRFNLSEQTDTGEFIGQYVPVEGQQGKFQWKDGILVEAMKRGDWIIFDEINLANPAILERINSLLDPDRSITLTEKENEEVRADPKCRIFATGNPATYQGRKELSPAWRNRFTEIWIPEITDPAQLKQIVGTWLQKLEGGQDLASRVVDFHNEMKEKTASKEIGAAQRGGFIYTLRNLFSLSQYLKEFLQEEGPTQAFTNGALHCYADNMVAEEDVKKVEALVAKHAPPAKS
jgi:midasin